AEHAALLVRVTARISAGILAADLLVAARRVGSAEAGRHARSADIATFAAFIVSHTIHFICVGLLTVATAGENVRIRGGPIPVVAFGLLFYVACLAVLHVKRRPAARWTNARDLRLETWLVLALWVTFFQAYATRFLQSWLFTVLAAGLAYSVARFVARALRSNAQLRASS
ncbi:MAG: hypothetical protein HY047_15375, partial [Acidobacteria bacterium]|nr:hypothetical protein [Acidobacteriota bacterium]